MTPREAYERLKRESIETSLWRSLRDLAAWDQRTYLPRKGHPYRADQLALLAIMIHERETNPRIGDYLDLAEDMRRQGDPDTPESVNLREWRRDFERKTKIPKDLAEAMARATAEGETAWETARRQNLWATFKPHFERILGLLKEKADALGFEEEPYDALIEDYEPGETAGSVAQVFDALREPLIDLTARVKQSPRAPDTELLNGNWDIEAQKSFSKRIASMIGFDFDAGRLDESVHPFTIGIGPKDVRITTRYSERSFLPALFGTLHETGHALYEQGLDKRYFGTPMGSPVSLGIHESQSRFFENFIGRSRQFWQLALPLVKQTFGDLDDVDLDAFLLAANQVTPSFIRVEADEVTYNLHIIMRFELELMLLRGDISVDDLTDAWNDKMQRYFQLTPKEASSGVLQDVHWAAGLFGYFPTYTLGNLYAAQLFAKISNTYKHLEGACTKEGLLEISNWLKENIHKQGASLRPRDLILKTTGAPLDPQCFLIYCQKKYSDLYGL